MKILEVRPEQVICEINGQISTRPNSPYYSLKYFKYDNRRIAYTFSDKSFVRETYDDRIFNCWHEGNRIQLRQDLSERLAAAIDHHEMYGNIREYVELFKMAYAEIPFWDILDLYLKHVKGVDRTKEGFIVYGDFKIDYQGNAWVKPQFPVELKSERDAWYSLCIVMQGTGHRYEAKQALLPDQFGKLVEVNAITMTIISKIMFLLNPNLTDKPFRDQLSKKLLMKLMRISGGE
ncbi:MAG: hypothetical protein QQN44_01845 [Nitrosopumilus sp.]